MLPHHNKSTTVRSSHEGAGARAVRAGLGGLARVAPVTASRLALRLFMRPPRPGRGRASAVPPRAERFAARAGGELVRGVRLGNGPAVLLVHGWGGWGAQLAAFARPLAEAGCTAVWYDGPGHGASSGRTATIPQLADALAAVARAVGARAAIAHSVGGAALALALERGLPLDAAVLVAPPRAPEAFFERFCAATGLGPRARDLLRARIERLVGLRMSDLTVPDIAARLATPALVVHDRADGEVPFGDGEEIARAWPGARFRATDGLGHRRVLRDPRVVAEATAFAVSRLARCGCGRLATAVAAGAPRCDTCLLSVHLADRDARAPGRPGVLRAVAAAR